MRTGTLVSCVMLVEMPGHDDVVICCDEPNRIYVRRNSTQRIKHIHHQTISLLPAVAVYQRLGDSRAPHRYLYPGDV